MGSQRGSSGVTQGQAAVIGEGFGSELSYRKSSTSVAKGKSPKRTGTVGKTKGKTANAREK